MKGAAFSERRAVPDKNAAAYAAEKLLISVTKNYIIPREENKMNKKVISALLCGAMVLGAATPVMAEGRRRRTEDRTCWQISRQRVL